MKIIRIIARLNVGGPARHVTWLTSALQDEEFSTVLVAGRVPAGEQDMGYLAEAKGISPVFIEEMSRELSVKDVVSLLKVFRLIKREKPDIIHTHTAKAGTVGRAAAFLYRWLTPGTLIGRPRAVRVVHTFHGHVFHSYYGKAKTRFFVLIEKALARFATDKIITISEQQLNEINKQVGIGSTAQFAVIGLGIDLDEYARSASNHNDLRNELSLGEDKLIVSFVGRLTEIKNIPMYLETAQKYQASVGPDTPDLHFLVVGDGHLRAELEAKAWESGLENTVFLGNRQDVAEVYHGTDIVALTSLNEGTPLSLIEAMASRRPVIATMVGGVVDLLGRCVEEHDGFMVCERGVGVRSGDVQGFLKGLIYLVNNEALRAQMAKQGYAFVQASYGKDRLIEDIKQLYRGMMAGA